MRTYVVREFSVCKREDADNLIIDCKTFVATMYNNYKFKVSGEMYSNENFHEMFSINIP